MAVPSSRGGNEGGKHKEQKGTAEDVAAVVGSQPRPCEAPGRGGLGRAGFPSQAEEPPLQSHIQSEALAELTYQPLQCEEAAPALGHCPDLPFSCIKTDGFVYFQWELRNLYEIREPL